MRNRSWGGAGTWRILGHTANSGFSVNRGNKIEICSVYYGLLVCSVSVSSYLGFGVWLPVFMSGYNYSCGPHL